ncbi:uncharacterized protein BJ171DRAFT_511693 [Polychytrium aggregatum]|uniref:uncharacterized protein n=1 Tax=Polychytrium aggregatum TaxID=110093 RepID=UPI0022FE97F7|nr:uncharacterized protein BJ171DRAFT_511693 [Polychytrium aggregatum]KAI9203063.1 hypothetical protein BJ171DRAFT_511693 [Polychytrium aggregatum]
MKGKAVLIVGGTQGMGAASALRFAAMGSSVTIVGRNSLLGEGVVSRMRAAAPSTDSRFRFRQLDVTSMKGCREFCHSFVSDLRSEQAQLGAVVLCAGNLNYGPRRLTSEGLESGFALNFLSRFLMIRELLPFILEHRHDTRIVNVLGAGNGGSIDYEDLQLEHGFSFIRAAVVHATLTDLTTLELGQRYKDHPSKPCFYHMFPGVVATNALANGGFPCLIAKPASWVAPLLFPSAEKVSKTIVSIASDPEYGHHRSPGLLGPSGSEIRVPGYLKDSKDKQLQIWRVANEILDRI